MKSLAYPKPLVFVDSNSGVIFTVAKGCLVGGLDFTLKLDNGSNVQTELSTDLWDTKVLQLINWLKEWRRVHEINNGPLEPKMVPKRVTIMVPEHRRGSKR